MGNTKHIYFSDFYDDKIKKLQPKELSKICQDALLDHFNMKPKTLEEIEGEMRVCDYELEKFTSRKDFLETQKKKILEEKDRLERERELKEAKESEKWTQWKKTFMEIGGDRGISPEVLKIYWEDYKDRRNEYGGILQYFDRIQGNGHDKENDT